MEDYLTLQELAERSGYSVSTIMRYKKQGKIPFYQPGGPGCKMRFPADALERTHTPPDKPSPFPTDQKPLPGPKPKWTRTLN